MSLSEVSGSTQLTPTPVGTPAECDVTVSHATRLRETPDTSGTQIKLLQPNAPLKIYERSADNLWLYGELEGKRAGLSPVT